LAKKNTANKADEKKAINDKFEAQAQVSEDAARDAWVGVLIPAVGSAAFFGSMMVNVMRTYARYGWPKDAFSATDRLLMGIPVLIVGIAFYEGLQKMENGG
jgi:hypothetical protein|tara:strand:- start:232 stop:534 length:303 start_codon:yes stop_codon:yes gene_type:complete